MKIEELLKELDHLRTTSEEEYDKEMQIIKLILLLVQYINNPKISEAIDDIPF